ncbi:MAG TPA: hypothetical protein DD651_03680, partial [Trichococcus sp.]|nr:hypothetical protein [Trichococcus sp.]
MSCYLNLLYENVILKTKKVVFQMMFELRITLLDVGIPVWRDIQLDDDTTFSDLHFILQSA